MTTEQKKTTEQKNSAVSGQLLIDDGVLDAIAATAVEEVEGVYSLGRTGIAGAIDSVRGTGVSSEHGRHEAAFDFDLVVHYGYNIPDVVTEVRAKVAGAIQQMTDLETVEINIRVRDLHREETPQARQLD